jgi:hypothetical protein
LARLSTLKLTFGSRYNNRPLSDWLLAITLLFSIGSPLFTPSRVSFWSKFGLE